MAQGTPQRTYKRSWKNLLINKDYQLRMTMVLVSVSALLMAGLGWWVMSQARTATEVAANNVEGTRCEQPPWMEAPSRIVVDEITAITPAGTDVPIVEPDLKPGDLEPGTDDGAKLPADPGADGSGPDKAPEPAADPKQPPAAGNEAGTPATADGPQAPIDEADEKPADGSDQEEDERTRPRVTITNSDIELQSSGGDAKEALAQVNTVERERQEKRYHECQMAKRAKVQQLQDGEKLIMRVLVGLGVLLILGLAAYGIKMTHRVAGPLFKVSLYLNKLRDNRYDTVYNLRKGDHLVDFYEHFKAAHAGVSDMQKEDITRLRAILEAAEEADLASKSPELAAAIKELRSLLSDRESSIV